MKYLLLILLCYQLYVMRADPRPLFVLRRQRGFGGALLAGWDGRRVKLGIKVEWSVRTV